MCDEKWNNFKLNYSVLKSEVYIFWCEDQGNMILNKLHNSSLKWVVGIAG